MNAEFKVRALTSGDAAAVAMIESQCPEAAQWGEDGYRQIDTNGTSGWAWQEGRALAGFILVRVVGDEMEILNLAVEPAARRKGIASRLLSTALENGSKRGVDRVYLEVRETNQGARAFYTTRGFEVAGRRKAYYSTPVEDALVLVLTVRKYQ